ncbi:MAG: hypothetical protein Tsb0010_02420 [Parvularculaceae bacterium]
MTQSENSLAEWTPVRARNVSRAGHAADAPPVLLVVIDTEEEFDWSEPFDRRATGVDAFSELPRLQEIFDQAGARPTYAIDYPVASTEKSVAVLKDFAQAGRMEIAAHLHPWVNPPHEEDVCPRNSYPGNLPGSLEEEKLARLAGVIEDNFGARPRVYKAGRYGVGPNTLAILKKLGFHCDLSLAPPFDFRGDGGPNYAAAPEAPFWIDAPGGVLEIPTTGGYYGALAGLGAPMSRALQAVPEKAARLLRGAASRAGFVTRARLSPEGHSLDALKKLTRALIGRGVRALTFSLHSPSAAIGYTSYAADRDARDRLLATCQGYLAFFRDEIGGGFATASEYRRLCVDALSGAEE